MSPALSVWCDFLFSGETHFHVKRGANTKGEARCPNSIFVYRLSIGMRPSKVAMLLHLAASGFLNTPRILFSSSTGIP